MSEFNQKSFNGGMNLIVDDTRLSPSEYREAFNLRNRFDALDQVRKAEELFAAPAGKKQGIYTFGDYVLIFVAGNAYYQLKNTTGWTQIAGFLMDANVERYYVETIPLNTTNYARKAVDNSNSLDGATQDLIVTSAIANLSGVLVQDGINQARFLFINPSTLVVNCRVTQKYSEWSYDSTGADDRREYVPIGTQMAWVDSILWILSTDRVTMFRSVSGRPLDFVINVDTNGNKGGDANTTAYNVGVPNITCMKSLNNGTLFVSAGGAVSYAVSINRNPGAPTLWGEPTFIRQFLFGAACTNDYSIIELLGDTAFVDIEGLRSFNAVLQTQNEGRNSVFSLKVAPLFRGIKQTASTTAAIVFDNYALFGVNTIYGYVIIVYDTLNQCFVSIDTQLNTYVKQFAKIETNTVELYCIGGDDKVYKLYSGSEFAISTVRTQSWCSAVQAGNDFIYTPKAEMQLRSLRCILTGFMQNSEVVFTVFTDNRLNFGPQTKTITFVAPATPYGGTIGLSDVDTQLSNIFLSTPNAKQGWKTFLLLSWTGGGRITNICADSEDLTPNNPLLSQGRVR